MSKQTNVILSYAFKLLLITAIAALCLALANSITSEPIRAAQAAKNEAAMREVFPEADRFTAAEVPTDSAYTAISAVATAQRGDEALGYVMNVSAAGFGGDIVLVVGINAEGKLTGIEVTSQKETPGLGTNITGEEFRSGYIGKSGQLTVVKGAAAGDNEVSAVSGATISSRGVTAAVNTALAYYNDVLKEALS